VDSKKTFLKSFIERISVNRSKVTVDYTLDIARKGAQPLTREVLPLKQNGYSNPIKQKSC